MKEPNFRWLMGGAFISALGDQFSMIALPWLVLTMTGSALKMGLVIALMSIPRAIFILIGGAVVDRSSPKTVLMWSKHANTALLAVLAVLVFTGNATLPLVCAFALGLGLASAFSIPSGTSMLPHVVAGPQLQAANGMMMGIRQLTMLAGPMLAALLFLVFGDGSGAGQGAQHGIAIAFGIDSASFLLSAYTLSKVQLLHAAPTAPSGSVLRSVADGMAGVWNDVQMRTCMLYWALGSFVVGGTMQVALPVLASTRLHGAASLGVLMGIHGAGTLIGVGIAAKGGMRFASLGTMLLAIDVAVGLLLLPLGAVNAVWQAGVLMLAIGLLGGFTQIAVVSWIQQRVPREMMGRTMSIFMFIFMGVAPLAAAITGWLLGLVPLGALIAGAGGFLVLIAAFAWLFTPLRLLRAA